MLRSILQRAGGLGVGTAIGQGLILVATPFLVRIYEPEEFGALALLITISNIGIASGSARYDLAVPVASDDEVPALARLAVLLSVCLGILSGIVVGASAASVFDNQAVLSMGGAPIVAGLCFFLAATYQLAGSVMLQRNAIRMLSITRALQGAIFVALAAFKDCGLLLALALSYAPGIIILFPVLLSDRGGPDMKAVASKYRRFALFGLPGTLLDVVGYSLCIWVVLTVFGPSQSGELSQMQRLIGAPLMLASMSLGQILLKQAADLRGNPVELSSLVRSILKLLGFASILGVLTLALVGETVLAFLLGPGWKISSAIVVSLGVAVFVRATVSPLSSLLASFGRLDLALWWQILYFASALISFNLVARASTFEHFIVFYALHETVLYSIYLLVIFAFLRKMRCAESSAS